MDILTGLVSDFNLSRCLIALLGLIPVLGPQKDMCGNRRHNLVVLVLDLSLSVLQDFL